MKNTIQEEIDKLNKDTEENKNRLIRGEAPIIKSVFNDNSILKLESGNINSFFQIQIQNRQN